MTSTPSAGASASSDTRGPSSSTSSTAQRTPAPSMPRRKSSSQALHVGSLNTASFSAGLNPFGGRTADGGGAAGAGTAAFPSSLAPERNNGLGLGVGLGGASGSTSGTAPGSFSGGGSGSLSSSVGRGVGEGAGARIKRQVLGTEREVLVQRNGFGGARSTNSNGGGGAGAGSSPAAQPAPKLFDFRMTDRPGVNGANGLSSSTSPPTSLLSRQMNGAPTPALRTASTSNAVPTLASSSTAPNGSGPSASSATTGPSATRLSAVQHATSVSASRAAMMRPRAMSMTMKIKGELRENGDEVDPDDSFAGGEGEEGDVDMERKGQGKIVRDVGKGSGGIKGKRKGMVFRCESCSKVYRHPSCLSKHRWEHSPHWAPSSKFALSKHQQVQLLEAATILMHMDPSAIGGKTLPDDKNLWPEAVSPPARLARRLPQRSSFSQTLRPNFSPYTPSSSLPKPEVGGASQRRTSPGHSTDDSTDESSRRSQSVEGEIGEQPLGGPAAAAAMAHRRTSITSTTSNTNSLSGGFASGSPAGTMPRPSPVPRQSFGQAGGSPSLGSPSFGLAALGNMRISGSADRKGSYGSSTAMYSNTPLAPPSFGSPSRHLLSPAYASLGLPQSSLRGNAVLEEDDEEDEDPRRDAQEDQDMSAEDSPASDQRMEDEGETAGFGVEDMEM